MTEIEKPQRAFFVYLSVIAGALVVSIDFASVDLMVPALEKHFEIGLESVQWVINGYVVAFAVFMIMGGRLADAFGRRRCFIIGLSVFGFASLMGGMSWSGGSLIFFRVLQGIGAAFLWPAMIGMGCGALGAGTSGKVLGVILATCSIGNAAGPVVGGALTDWLSWRWVLWINVPIALLAIGITWSMIRDDKPSAESDRARNDYLGMVALSGGLIALMIFVYQGGDWGWADWRTISLGVAAIGLLGAFPSIEKRTKDALVPPEILGSKEIRTLGLAVCMVCSLFFIVLLYFTQYAMKFSGDSPTDAGALMISFMLSYGLVAFFNGAIYNRLGARRMLSLGLVIVISAAVYLALGGVAGSSFHYTFGLIILGIGVGATIPGATTRAIESSGEERASLASGTIFLCQLSGAALIMAIATVIFVGIGMGSLEASIDDKGESMSSAERTVASQIISASATIHSIPRQTVADLPHFAEEIREAYTVGLRWILLGNAALCALALIAVLLWVPRRPGTIAQAPDS